jgi:tetratricopeptide (TPR) repeat protein
MSLEMVPPSQVLAVWRDTVRRAPCDADAWQGLGIAFEAHGQFLRALEAFRQAAQFGAPRGQIEQAIGLLFLRHGFLEQAEAAFRAAGADPSQAADAHFNLGVVLLRRERYGEACAAFESFVAAERSNPAGHAYHGLALLALQRPAEAVVAFSRAHSCEPAYMADRRDLLRAWDTALSALCDAVDPPRASAH